MADMEVDKVTRRSEVGGPGSGVGCPGGPGVRGVRGGLDVGAQRAPRLLVKYELALSSSLIRPASLGGHADGNTGK